MSYKCICNLEFKSSNKLKNHKNNCKKIKDAIINSPICYCGEKLKPIIHNGILEYQKNCGKSECRSKHFSIKFKGTKWSDKRKINAFKLKIWHKEKIIKYGEFICKKCNKKFKSNTSLRAHKASCGHNNEVICEICNKKFKKNSGLATHKLRFHNNTSKGIKYRKKMKIIGQNVQKHLRNNPNFISNLEKYFENVFLKNIKYKKQFYIKTKNSKYYYDFYIKEKNLIIEVDGDYWHINPVKYNYEEMSDYIKEYKEKEIKKEAYIIKRGYNIIRFWENDIYNNHKHIKKELNKWLKQ